jgi:CheY-like chemotaxis protein
MRMIEPGDANLRWARDVIDRQVGHMVRMVDDLLDVSRITRGRVTLQAETVDLTAALDRALETARPLLDSRGHELAAEMAPGPVWVRGDLVRLAQVFANLLNNAAKFTPDGGRVNVTLARDGDTAIVCIRDTGIGIPPDLLPKVFDLFTQAERSLDRAQGGLGIGLSLVKTLVEMHGGTVEVHSAGPGRGSEFVVKLPVARRVAGHETATAHDGPSALAAAERFRPDVVLLDIGLPGMDGYEVARRLRAMGNGSKLMLVAVTGYGGDEVRRKATAAGFDRHLVKPVNPADVRALVGATPV